MIRLNFGANNNVIMTLSENVTIESPVYLCELTNQQSLDKSYLLLTDSSLYTNRYNKLAIYITDDPNCDSLAGEVCLTYTGFYDYKVYECTYPESYDKAEDFVSTIVGTLEIGLVWFIPSEITDATYSPIDTDTIIYQNV